MADLYQLTEASLAALAAERGLELVDVERAGQGLLRVTIDKIADETAGQAGVLIEDCEAVSRQLSRVFEVENVDYSRLEVGSPGTDRPLRRAKDFVRFAGERAEIKLRLPLQGRKVFTGTLVVSDADGATFGIEFESKEGETQLLNFTLDDIERAKLDPILNFKGKKR